MDRREAWQDAARAVGGTFKRGKRSSADSVVIGHGPWTITVDTHTVDTGEGTITYTRAKALFIGRGDPKLLVRKRNVFDTILESMLAESSLTVAVKKALRKDRKAHDPQACQADVYRRV